MLHQKGNKMKKPAILLIAAISATTCFADTILVHSIVAIPDSILLKSLNVGVNKGTFWDKNLQPIISGIVGAGAIALSLISILVSKKNLDKQLKIQLATTVEKEWIERVRIVTSEILRYTYLLTKHKRLSIDYETLIRDITDNYIKLELLLDSNKPLQKEHLDSAFLLVDKIVRDKENIDSKELIILRSNLISAAHKLFEVKKFE